MTSARTITIFYDASCPFCSQEITNIKHYDDSQEMVLVDCSAPCFDDSPFAKDNITRQDMMNALHIRDAEGQWFKGIEAFEIMYDRAGFHRIAALFGHPATKPLGQRLYPWIARNRYLLSRIGMVQVLAIWGKIAAKHADRRAQNCKEGQCPAAGQPENRSCSRQQAANIKNLQSGRDL